MYVRGQTSLFSSSETAAMTDRTRSRKYSPINEQFAREHREARAWGLEQRHTAKLHRIYGDNVPVTADDWLQAHARRRQQCSESALQADPACAATTSAGTPTAETGAGPRPADSTDLARDAATDDEADSDHSADAPVIDAERPGPSGRQRFVAAIPSHRTANTVTGGICGRGKRPPTYRRSRKKMPVANSPHGPPVPSAHRSTPAKPHRVTCAVIGRSGSRLIRRFGERGAGDFGGREHRAGHHVGVGAAGRDRAARPRAASRPRRDSGEGVGLATGVRQPAVVASNRAVGYRRAAWCKGAESMTAPHPVRRVRHRLDIAGRRYAANREAEVAGCLPPRGPLHRRDGGRHPVLHLGDRPFRSCGQ